jgi:hypothetical protein
VKSSTSFEWASPKQSYSSQSNIYDRRKKVETMEITSEIWQVGVKGSLPHKMPRSMLKMMDLEADILCEGHFGVIRGKEDVKRFIQSYV